MELVQHSANSQETLSRIELLQQLKASETPKTEETYFQIVVIALNGELYGIKILAVREILKFVNITWLPCTPDYITGVISVRGDIQSVVDLKYFLQIGQSSIIGQNRIILAESGELVTGLLVDEMVDILNIPESALLPITETHMKIAYNYIEGKISWNEKMITLLNIDEIIRGVVVEQP